MQPCFLGIDPGLEGALCLLSAEGAIVGLYDMPILKGKRSSLDEGALVEMLEAMKSISGIQCAVLEIPHCMPGQRVTSTATQWEGVGMLKMGLASLRIPRRYVSPKDWQKVQFGGLPKGLDTKKRALEVALQRWPLDRDTFFTPRGRHLDGRTDALLIADYARRIG